MDHSSLSFLAAISSIFDLISNAMYVGVLNILWGATPLGRSAAGQRRLSRRSVFILVRISFKGKS